MSVNSKMTAIADAIRALTGTSGSLTLDQMASQLETMPKPGWYLQPEYIKSTGVEHINTGFVPDSNSRVVIDFEVTDGSSVCAVFGTRAGSTSKAFSMWVTPGSTKINPQYGSVAYNNKEITLSPNQRLTYDMNKNVVKVGSNSVTCTSATFECEKPLILFGQYQGDSVDSRKVIGKLYSCKVYDNGNLVRDFVPVNYNGEYGLFDMLDAKFYGNEGTGAFTV